MKIILETCIGNIIERTSVEVDNQEPIMPMPEHIADFVKILHTKLSQIKTEP